MAQPFTTAGAANLPVTIQILLGPMDVTARGITNNRVSLDTSEALDRWAVRSGIVLGVNARAKATEQPGWSIPIRQDGSVKFSDLGPRTNTTTFYRVRSPGPGWTEARQVWTSLKIGEYRYHFRRNCFCFGPPGDGIVHVKNGKVVDVEELSSPRVPPGPIAGDPALYPTVEGLFSLLDEFEQSGADVIQFSLDPVYGFPSVISVDSLLGAIDDEVGYTATDFQPLQ